MTPLSRIPLVLVSDAPFLPTGVSRIATDLAARIWTDRDDLGIEFLHVGYTPFGPLPQIGAPLAGAPWPVWAHSNTDDWGAAAFWWATLQRDWAAGPGIVLYVQDPARTYPHLPKNDFQRRAWTRWGYFSVDAVNVRGQIGGPAGQAIRVMDRLAGYSNFGAEALVRTLGAEGPSQVEILPHGIDRSFWTSAMTADEHARAVQRLNPTGSDQIVIGCVATNQPRKDLGLFLRTIARLRDHYKLPVRGWLHVDQQIGEAWSVPELAATLGLGWEALTVTSGVLTDRDLAAMYALCALTIAPGRGEGFGFPILESLACGRPCVHLDHGGGAELIPERWRVDPEFYHVEGPYALVRPYGSHEWLARIVIATLKELDEDAISVTAEIAERTRRYDWSTLWPETWRPWIQAGVAEARAEGFR